MFVWIGIVSCILIASSFSSGLMSAILDFAAFVIIVCLGVWRLNHNSQRHKPRNTEFKEELNQVNNESDRMDITP